MKIQVTQEDIDGGIMMNCSLCPIARALHRLGLLDAVVSPRSVRLDGTIDSRTYFSADVADRIYNFDSGCGMTPFEFEVAVPVALLSSSPLAA